VATKPQPTFVIGVPRSGTTLLRILLDSHSQIAAGPESGWITGDYTETSLKSLTELLGDGELGLIKNFPGTSEKHVMRATAKLLTELFKPYLDARRKPLLVLKTPNDIAHLDFLRKLMPRANYIHILRDGRDVALSTIAKKGTYFSDTTLGYEFGDLNFVNALRRWMVWEQRAAKVLNRIPQRVHTLKYEDLVAKPEPQLRALCEFMQQPFEPEMLNYAQQQHEYPDWEAGSSDVRNTDSIFESSVARWKGELSAADVAAIPANINDYLMARGYEDTYSAFDSAFLSVAKHTQAQQVRAELQAQIDEANQELANAQNALETERQQKVTSQQVAEIVDTRMGQTSEEVMASLQALLNPLGDQSVQHATSLQNLAAELTLSQATLNELSEDRKAAQELQKLAQLSEELAALRSDFAEQKEVTAELNVKVADQSTKAAEQSSKAAEQSSRAAEQSMTAAKQSTRAAEQSNRVEQQTLLALEQQRGELASLQSALASAKAESESTQVRTETIAKDLEIAQAAKDKAIRTLAEDRKRHAALLPALAELRDEAAELQDKSTALDEENSRLKNRMAQISNSTASLQRIISQQERETWEKEQVIQGMLTSRTWKTGRVALGPMALVRNAFRKSPAPEDTETAKPLSSSQLRELAETESREAEEALKASEAHEAKVAELAREANNAREAEVSKLAKEANKAHEAKSSRLAREADKAQQSRLAGEASAARAVAEAIQASEASKAKNVESVEQSREFALQQAATQKADYDRALGANTPSADKTETADSAIQLVPVPDRSDARVNLGAQVEEYFGAHRSGWAFAVQHLAGMHDAKAIQLDTFIERTFCWEGGRGAILEPWLGIIHVPPTGPDWFTGNQSNRALFESDYWKASAPYCRGLFCLSNYHRRELRKMVDLPIETLIHPTETPDILWSPERFKSSKRPQVVQLGWWLRVLHSIYELPTTQYEKIFLRPRDNQAFLDALAHEHGLHVGDGLLTPKMERSVTEIEFLENEDYDRLLSESVVFMHLYDASANNAVIECIVRNTPLLINPLDPVVEYLGAGYPLYFTSLKEAAEKLENRALVIHAHEYLKNLPIKEKLTGEYFMSSLQNSTLLRNAHS